MTQLKTGAFVFLAIIVLDFLWLGLIMKDYYLSSYGDLARTVNGEFKPQLIPAFFVYLFLAVGIVFFVQPTVQLELDWIQVGIRGALLGLVIYGVYDMTALSVLKDWPVGNSIVDIVWGAVVCGVASAGARLLAPYLGGGA